MVFSKRSFSWASFVGSISRYHPLDEVIVELGYLGKLGVKYQTKDVLARCS
ncbi:hypothetical protein ACOMICROBIO_LMKGKHOH_02091 [Vibrio sp. B1FIG11]|nr:hypothetical protein ACOMICROBIO_LMKGKHOH_02091 [Vibrio sp. B1FIG11]CAE6901179.1 hypothetical protein ACOMICROBIO_LMKGKHOH_02091 [Vibrio sp. B1FIG11]